ncbi:MAG: glycoside hydrolase family protein [Rectinema sp.]|nr:glycoside hydrolase family protein [Rectinema sp.]
MNARDLIKKHEGLRLEVYKDSLGYDTIGYGHLITGYEQPPIKSKITQERAEELFERDYAEAERVAREMFPDIDEMPEARRAALIDMAFNLGWRILKFRRFSYAVAQRDWLTAICEMCRSRWAKQVPGRVIDLIPMIAKGEWA